MYLICFTFSRHGLDLTCEDQPLLKACKLVEVRNFLHKCNYKKEKGSFLLRRVFSCACWHIHRAAYLYHVLYQLVCAQILGDGKTEHGPVPFLNCFLLDVSLTVAKASVIDLWDMVP